MTQVEMACKLCIRGIHSNGLRIDIKTEEMTACKFGSPLRLRFLPSGRCLNECRRSIGLSLMRSHQLIPIVSAVFCRGPPIVARNKSGICAIKGLGAILNKRRERLDRQGGRISVRTRRPFSLRGGVLLKQSVDGNEKQTFRSSYHTSRSVIRSGVDPIVWTKKRLG